MQPDPNHFFKTPQGYRLAMDFYDRELEKLTVPYQTAYVETRYGKTHVISAGSEHAPPVMLFHGLGANAPTWRLQIDALAVDYRVYAPDTIGDMGKSDAVRLDRKGSAYGEWAADVITGLGLKQVNTVGISNGGWLTLKLATAAPDKIASAILISSAGFANPALSLIWKMFPMLAISPLLSLDTRAKHFLRVMSPPNWAFAEQDLEMFKLLFGHFRYQMSPPALSDAELRCLTAPTYLMIGQYEAAFPGEKVIERAKKVLPNLVNAEIIPGVGHGMITENPPLVNEKIRAFIASQVRRVDMEQAGS